MVALQDLGHKRLLLEAGEHPKYNPIEYILESIKTIYSIKHKNGQIRRLNVNIAATTVENYRKLHDAEIGTYQLFQETYHRRSTRSFIQRDPRLITLGTQKRMTALWKAALMTSASAFFLV